MPGPPPGKADRELAQTSAFNIEREIIVSEAVDRIAEELPSRTGDTLTALVVDTKQSFRTAMERKVMQDLRVALGQHDVIYRCYDIVESIGQARATARPYASEGADLDDFGGSGEVSGWKLEDIYVLRIKMDMKKQDRGERLRATTWLEVVYPKEQNRTVWSDRFQRTLFWSPEQRQYVSEATLAERR